MSIPLIAGMTAQAMFATSLAVSAVTTGVGYLSEKQNAEAQAEAQNQNIQNQQDAANIALSASVGDLQQRDLQEQKATALKVNNAAVTAREATSTALASSESSGLSLEALTEDYDRQYLNYSTSQMEQLGYNQEQIERQREGLQAQAEGRMNTIPTQVINQPSLGSALVGLGTSALGAYDEFSVIDPLTGQRTLT